MARVPHREAAPQPQRAAQDDRAHGVRIDVLLHLDDQFRPGIMRDDQRVVDAGQISRCKSDVDHNPGDACYRADVCQCYYSYIAATE